MNPTITAFERSPDRGRGLARDMRVRWAFEEVGQPYDVRLVSFPDLKKAPHRERNPFGQIPTFEEGGLTLFESGAIVLRIAERHAGLLPADPDARARVIAWMFAAVSTVDPPIMERSMVILLESKEPWGKQRLAMVEERVRRRLAELSGYLGERDWLEGDFGAADVMMVHVLLRLRGSGLLEERPNVAAYVARGEARPAYQRAFAAQLAVFRAAEGG
jgi:glutathione S-transferase